MASKVNRIAVVFREQSEEYYHMLDKEVEFHQKSTISTYSNGNNGRLVEGNY